MHRMMKNETCNIRRGPSLLCLDAFRCKVDAGFSYVSVIKLGLFPDFRKSVVSVFSGQVVPLVASFGISRFLCLCVRPATTAPCNVLTRGNDTNKATHLSNRR